jgi:alpha-tubulin suppressor-like RCC1 family protein
VWLPLLAFVPWVGHWKWLCCSCNNIASLMESKLDDVVGCGFSHIAVLTQDEKVVCWGSNEYGQCDVPAILEDVVAVHCGAYFTAALLMKGTVICWGHNESGQCDVPAGVNFVAVSCGYSHTSGITQAATVVCWGDHVGGICNVPEGLKNVIRVHCSLMQSVALTREGEVVCWGLINGLCNLCSTEKVTAISCGVFHFLGLTES